jgi:hypothetical protein
MKAEYNKVLLVESEIQSRSGSSTDKNKSNRSVLVVIRNEEYY